MTNVPHVDQEFPTHLFTYRHDGAQWVLQIKARDAEDAKQRLGKLAYATYDGVLVAKLPATCGWVAKVLCALRRVVVEI